LKRRTTYTHDLAGNILKEETTGNWSNADIAGPSAVTDVTSYVYDAAGRRVSQTVENTGGVQLTTSWTFDQRGLETSMTTPRGNASGAVKADFTTTYTYDQLGRKVKTVAPKVQPSRTAARRPTFSRRSWLGTAPSGRRRRRRMRWATSSSRPSTSLAAPSR
jgi:YD repeat-containing protein